uniref:DUF4435 domain-containing protein n=1 Tax=Cyanothece sp. (strain PCC 7425 / ATCC 29141) TaxID=395961 RepID=B8HRN0_CYAP4
MSLSPENLRKHCQNILQSSRIRNRVVVLCEGDLQTLQGRPSPQTYARMESLPDSNFYKACTPKFWRERIPQFFNCGDRKDVIDTYFGLLDLHSSDPENSYLNPDKLFAIVDLDLHTQNINSSFNYGFAETEEIYHDLYQKYRLTSDRLVNHKIWVTGLIHKEAYFIIPDLQDTFNELPIRPTYNGSDLNLDYLYLNMSQSISSDPDLAINFDRACRRICHCSSIDTTAIDTLEQSWITEFTSTPAPAIKTELVYTLLTIKKAKSYWNNISPSPEWTRPVSAYLDQAMLKVADFYSEQSDGEKYHLPSFFQTLYECSVT